MDESEVKKLADLARLSLQGEEVEQYRNELSEILSYVSHIQEMELSDNVSEDDTAFEADLLRVDEGAHEAGEYTEALLQEAPQTKDGYVKVRKIL